MLVLMKNLCPKKEECGSCGWSHIPYQNQLDQKLSDINGSFKIKELDFRCPEILAAPKTSHYRNRMDFVIDFEGRVGLRQKGKWWKVIDDHTCFISDEQIEYAYHKVRTWSKLAGLTYFDRKAHHGFLRYAVIRTSTLSQTMLTIVTSAPKDEEEEKLAKEAFDTLIKEVNPTTFIWSINNTVSDVSFGDDLRVLHGSGQIQEEINATKYLISPNAFFQTNPHGARLLQDTVREFAGDLKDKTLLDLYCGTGFFAIDLAPRAKRTIGIELVPEAIEDAKKNAALNNVTAEFHDAKTEEFDWGTYNADVVILDPPRSGMHDQALKDVMRIKPKRIVYISCGYKNFAREMVTLKDHYNVGMMRAIDMFPHTPHVELITQLNLK
jgi:23S rRNA (uracil1939-C5)-methyltransferase